MDSITSPGMFHRLLVSGQFASKPCRTHTFRDVVGEKEVGRFGEGRKLKRITMSWLLIGRLQVTGAIKRDGGELERFRMNGMGDGEHWEGEMSIRGGYWIQSHCIVIVSSGHS